MSSRYCVERPESINIKRYVLVVTCELLSCQASYTFGDIKRILHSNIIRVTIWQTASGAVMLDQKKITSYFGKQNLAELRKLGLILILFRLFYIIFLFHVFCGLYGPVWVTQDQSKWPTKRHLRVERNNDDRYTNHLVTLVTVVMPFTSLAPNYMSHLTSMRVLSK